MGDIQEAKYIQVIWQDQATAKKIVESHEALELEAVDENTVQVEIVNYSQIDNGSQGQFAIRLDSQSDDVPRFVLENGRSIELLPVTDPVTGLCWWVEGKTWDKQRGRWLSDIYRGAGQVRIQVGAHTCRVNISSSTFTHQQLEGYLRDFQTDFWELILDDTSYISAAAKRSQHNLLDETTLRAIRKFIECVDRVLQKPKVELREVQRLKPRKDVRPVPRTFMELSTRGTSRTLTSRAYQETSDIPDNRYAHYALRKVYQITKALCTVAATQARSIERSLVTHRQRLSKFSNQKVINKDAVMHDMQDKERALRELESQMSTQNNYFAQLICEQPVNGQPCCQGTHVPRIQVAQGKRADYIQGVFLAVVRSRAGKDWFKPHDGGYVTVDFGVFSDQIRPEFEYEIFGDIDYNIIRTKNKKPRHNFTLLAVSEFRIVYSEKYEDLTERFRVYQQKVGDMESRNWRRPLRPDEAEQQQRETISIGRIIGLVEAKHENLATLSRELAPKLHALREALAVFEKKKVKLDARFPNSMTYVQNPAYQGIHSAFSKIKERSGIDDDEILLALDRIEEIGLVNISMLYERWCLLQIIKVLVFKYRYRPEEGWKRKLITQVLDQGRNVAIDFEHSQLHRKIRLHYEMELENGKRPDFVLDVVPGYNDSDSSRMRRFVMDAKFYQEIDNKRHGGLQQIVYELYNQKDYAEGGQNAVFVMHPSSSALPIRATPQEWSRDNYYGEVRLFDWDEYPPNHRYGGIYLSPIGNGAYLDSLQRAIGMFLQYGIENNNATSGKHGALPENPLFCLVCGSSDVSCRQSPKNQKAWWVTCNDCNHFTTFNYCGGCGNRLIKNGEYWSYHAMEPLNPFNIKCPSCGDLL
ncbi:hypothetical protein ebA4602 [Aromatoleum aromaticum EbN1]|uniref:Uncharacterized protein n=1 Tax=Aromatoleum aromaticum (strain DSM 19018 / LMG 30748 / EbN1) TaxID=76114 RepID=Q5P1T2_AROAE|nr:nuclease domain-containing protein [Aromatoleum aromaticum]CAI08732.1 hypothetical protein ebA4602 [Aromatoleum aromaticum EbN1]